MSTTKKTKDVVRGLDRRTFLDVLGRGGLALALGAGCAPGEGAREPGEGDETLLGESSALSLSLTTKLTADYGVQYPLVSAGMAFVSLPPLVAAVSNAGGIGLLGAAVEPASVVQARIQAIKALTSNLFGVDFIVENATSGPFTTQEHIDVCVAEGVRLVVFHWNPPDAAWVDALHAAGAKVWVQVGSVAAASQAVALGVDGIIAQGVQAGGHARATVDTRALVKDIKKRVRPALLLAAGGIADGASVVRALGYGADGVVAGTRFVASTEAYAHPDYKARLVAAGRDATALQTFFGPEWPNARQRVLRNRVVRQWAGRESRIPSPPPPPATIGTTVMFPGVLDVPYTMPKFSATIPTPDTVADLEEMDMPAGSESVLAVRNIKPAAEIVAEMMGDAQAVIGLLTILGTTSADLDEGEDDDSDDDS
ncbi:2-nitropropane dioxygenase [Sorangium cellulosum]|uniref:2-nitropropane dioxygenase n=1 Tax=Sorangium cellulosum TaxID=56 RepID=A0A2L0F0I3_SORCE|nr:nitronate monooxygenase [Sorangium cellulosum]AUX45078.1 2-nitropropane dioxygenase [Sorangium cellulosum]